MQHHKVIVRGGTGPTDEHLFETEARAIRFYRENEPADGVKISRHVFDGPRKQAFGHYIPGEWREVESKNGAEEFA